jgi:formate-dependent nitrite reductase cytochrome c552 subunit
MARAFFGVAVKHDDKTRIVLVGIALGFLTLAAAFSLNFWGHPPGLYPITPVESQFLETATIRKSYAELIRAKADLSDFDCYACHDRKKPPTLRFDANQNIIVPSEHSDVVMGHGSHNRNNNCFNCHDEQNLELLQTRDGRQVKLADSPPLCGSCHGPTYRDWEAGAHGRTGGFWSKGDGEIRRQICVDCHNPHQPKIPPRKPAPGPHPLRPMTQVSTATAR